MVDEMEVEGGVEEEYSESVAHENVPTEGNSTELLLPYEKAIKYRKILVKNEYTTDYNYGQDLEERTVDELIEYGIINVNKPKGPTSHEVADYVKRIFRKDKAGQSGTLDPGVTGVLPVGLLKSTRVLRVLLTCGKEYVCLMHIHKELDEKFVRDTIMSFVGKIMQMPPIKSAVKRELRERRIYYIEIYEIDGRDILFRVGCEAGTYIRKLCDDIGKKLGCGAHMAQLVRTKVGMFDVDNSYTMQDISDAYSDYWITRDESRLRQIIFPLEKAVEHLPKIWVSDNAIEPLCQGFQLAVPGIAKLTSDVAKSSANVAVLSLKGELVGIGVALLNANEILEKTNGYAVKLDTVIMEPGTYPKWDRAKMLAKWVEDESVSKNTKE